MKRIIVHIITCCCLLAAPALAGAQVLAKASVDRDKILIGEPVQLTLDVHVPLGQTVTWFNLDTIPHFEWIHKGKADTSESIDGKKIQQLLTITSFDSGSLQIPALALMVDGKPYYTDTIDIEVAWTQEDISGDYKDIRAIEEVPPPWWVQYIPWVIGLVTVLAIGLIVYFLRRKKTVVLPEKPAATRLSAYEEALLALEELRKQGWAQQDLKSYYSRLNDILRLFVARRLRMATLEKTNEELIIQLRQMPMDKENFHQLATALRMADFVKFARYQPGVSDNEKNFVIIQSAITTLNNLP